MKTQSLGAPEKENNMVDVFIRHKIKDYGTWKQVFDEFAAKRRAGGEVAYRVAAVSDEPNNLCLFFEWRVSRRQRNFSGPQSWPAKWSGLA
jgi:hypothetical protein